MSDSDDPTPDPSEVDDDATGEIPADPTTEAPTTPEARELAALRAERDALKAQLDTSKSRRRFWHTARGWVAVVGVVVSCLLVAGAVLGIWANRSFLQTDGFVERAGGLIDEPEVRASLSAWLTDEVNQLIDAEEVIADALPDEASLLAVPLSGAVQEFVGDTVTSVVDSEAFRELWKGAVQVAHETATAVLEGDSDVLIAEDDRIVINLIPIINEVLAEITSLEPEIFGQTVSLPEVTVDDVPEEAAQAIGDALGVEVDEDFGTFTIYDEGSLSAAQQAVDLADQLIWLLVILAPLAVAGTLWVSTRRRRTLLQLTVGIALTMVLLRRLVLLFQDDLLELVQNPENVGAVDATASAFLDPLLDGALWVGIAALVIAAVAAVSGPYGWAVSLRRNVVGFVQGAVTTVSDRSQDEETLVWVAVNRTALQIGGVVVGLLLLWWLEVEWLGFFILAGVVGLYELGVTRFADRGDELRGAGEEGPDEPEAGETEPEVVEAEPAVEAGAS